MNCFIYIIATFLLINGCTSPSKLSTWTPPTKSYTTPNKILVVGIVHDSLIDIRKDIEDYFVQALKAMGYNAEAAMEAFGNKALARFDQEQTYLNLCNQGIDAVLTIALLNENKATNYHDPEARKNTSSYYYNRILNYKAIRARPKDHLDPSADQLQFLWEAILFNLSTLTPLYWAQSKPFAPASTIQNHETYSRIIMNSLQKQKVLNKRFLAKL
jgi:hypothetical protein